MLFGHIAISALLHRYLDVGLRPAVAGGIFPDTVDKTLCQVLHITPSGRMYAHTLLSAGLTSLGVGLIWGRRAGVSWGLGYLGHLLSDSTGFVPWFYPFSSYRFYRGTATLFGSLNNFFVRPKWIEWVLLLWAVWAFTFGQKTNK